MLPYAVVQSTLRAICWMQLPLLLIYSSETHADPLIQVVPIATTENFLSLPECPATYQSTTVTDHFGQPLNGPHGNLYCFKESLGAQSDRFLESLEPILPNAGRIADIYLSATYQSSVVLAEGICDLVGASRPSFHILSQDTNLIHEYSQLNANPKFTRYRLNPYYIAALAQCASSITIVPIGCDYYLEGVPETQPCPERSTNTHHTKFIVFSGDQGSVQVFGSGNLSDQSLGMNVEHWLATTTSIPFESTQTWCIVDFLAALSKYPSLSFKEQSEVYNACKLERRAVDELEIYMLPFERDLFRRKLTQLASGSTEVWMIAQDFDSEFLYNLIETNPNVAFTIFVEDTYWYLGAMQDGSELNFIDQAVAKRLLDADYALENLSLRFLQVNHHYNFWGASNSVHARSMIFFSVKEVISVMLGSAHFDDDAWRSNTEQQIFYSGTAVNQAREFFDSVMTRSVSSDSLASFDAIATREE